MAASVDISGPWNAWIGGFGNLEGALAPAIRSEWQQVADVFLSRTQDVVHVLTGRLLGSGHVAVTSAGGSVTATLSYDAPYAIYEEARGGTHAFLHRGYLATEKDFAEAMPKAWANVVAGWG